jgi:hypothetical protein
MRNSIERMSHVNNIFVIYFDLFITSMQYYLKEETISTTNVWIWCSKECLLLKPTWVFDGIFCIWMVG